MKSSLSLCLLLIAASSAVAAEPHTRWVRYPAISPDGKQIAFSYQGDLWLVPAAGGKAMLLTTHAGYERSPVWSPDSKSIAFASDRHGNFDVFIVPVTGGVAKRLSDHSAGDDPTAFSPDGKRVFFTSTRLDTAEASLGNSRFGELYSIAITGGRETQELTTPAEMAKPSKDGKLIAYYDYKGYEDEWRKHHQSPIARDVWVYERETGKHTQLTTFAGEDRDPVWNPAGDGASSIYFLSERAGSSNVFAMDVKNPAGAKQITKHATHPVRFLTIADDGTLCYGYHGEIFTKAASGEPKRIEIEIIADGRFNETELKSFKDGATEFAVSPKEDEVAFVLRGDIFVASVDHGTTRRVTDTAEQERSISFSPDGRSIYYAAERGKSWGIYRTELTRSDEDRFFNSTLLAEKVVLNGEDEIFQPVLSPDGKQIAFIWNRDEIRVLTITSKEVKTLVPAARNYSYRDGDIRFSWSPDGKWLAFTFNGHARWIDEVGVADVATGKVVNISESGYIESNPQWSRDSRALLFDSNRYGRRNHGSWGADGDLFALYLTRESWDRAMLSPEEFDRLKKKEEARKRPVVPFLSGVVGGGKDDDKDDEKDDDKKEDEPKEDNKKPEPVKPVKIELEDREHRLRRVTMLSAPIGEYVVSNDGEAILYLAQVERQWDLWLSRPRDGETRKLVSLNDESAGDLILSKNGKVLFVRRGNGRIEKIDLGTSLNRTRGSGSGSSGGSSSGPRTESINYSAEMTINTPQERAYLFEHMWRQVRSKFYDPKLHNVDWPVMKAAYAAFLPSITNNHDFAELMSELLGELNASHTGCRYRPRNTDGDATAALGLIYDVKHTGIGLRVAEVIARGPADKASSRIAAGVTITHIDGVELTPDVSPWGLLNRKDGKLVRLTLAPHPDGQGKPWEEVIKPISLGDESNLLYERWIKQRRALVEKFSDGKVGYVHIRSMADGSFRKTFQDALGINSDKAALVVDTRHNGGGWLHDDLVGFLGGRDYIWFTPRGKKQGELGAEPHQRWSRPVAVVQSESNYSDAHMFPFAFKTLGLGKLIGTPVAGTGTAVWWETQIDPTLVFGIPQVGMMTKEGKYLENLTLEPDVLIYNDPAGSAKGEDAQLKKAVEVLLEQVKK